MSPTLNRYLRLSGVSVPVDARVWKSFPGPRHSFLPHTKRSLRFPPKRTCGVIVCRLPTYVVATSAQHVCYVLLLLLHFAPCKVYASCIPPSPTHPLPLAKNSVLLGAHLCRPYFFSVECTSPTLRQSPSPKTPKSSC